MRVDDTAGGRLDFVDVLQIGVRGGSAEEITGVDVDLSLCRKFERHFFLSEPAMKFTEEPRSAPSPPVT